MPPTTIIKVWGLQKLRKLVTEKLFTIKWKKGDVEMANRFSNWASEASPTLGCSIEISRDIYICIYICCRYVSYVKSRGIL